MTGVAEINFPARQTCGREAALECRDGRARYCTLPLGHEGPHQYPPLDDLAPACDFGAEVCEVLGLDPGKVTDIRIRARAGALPAVSVNVLIDELATGELVTIARRYQLIPR